MNENIDLTENRMFRTPTPPDEITKVLISYTFGKFPWRKPPIKTIHSDEDLGGVVEEFTPLPLGDGTARKHRKFIENALSVEMCDRCGKPVQSFPWELRECLCLKCKQELEIECGTNRILKKYVEVIPNSDVLGWF